MTTNKHVSQFYNNDWFIYDGQEISGPVRFSNILEWFYSNDETQNHPYYVCQEGMSSWQSLKDTIDLHNKLQQFSVEEEKNKFIANLESQLEKINKDIKNSLSSSSSSSSISSTEKINTIDRFSKEDKLEENTIDASSTTIDNNRLNDINTDTDIDASINTDTNTNNTSISNDTAVCSSIEEEQTEQLEQSLDNVSLDQQESSNDNVQQEHRVHEILKNQTKSRTYKKSLKVPPLSSDMELIILTNRLRLGKTRSLLLSSLVFPILTCGLYIIYWLIATQLELTKFLNKKASSTLLLCSFLPVFNIFSIYHLLSLKKQLNTTDTNYKKSRILQFISSVVFSLILPIFICSFQNMLNKRWKMIVSSLQQRI